jgi:hypothetical protein
VAPATEVAEPVARAGEAPTAVVQPAVQAMAPTPVAEPPTEAPARAIEVAGTQNAPPTEAPTVEPTVAIVDISQDPNARSAIAPRVPTPTAAPTPGTQPTPVAVATSDQDLVGTVFTASMEPLVAGGRLGLVVGALALAGYFGVQRLRRR